MDKQTKTQLMVLDSSIATLQKQRVSIIEQYNRQRALARCKLADIVHDLTEVYNISEIAIDISGVGLGLADSFRDSGIKVIAVNRFGSRL